MSNIKVTQERIDHLMATADIQVETIFGKCTRVAVQLENGFILTESSACVDPANYDHKMGEEICLEHIRNKLWELEGYALQERLHSFNCFRREHDRVDRVWDLAGDNASDAVNFAQACMASNKSEA